MTTDAKGKQKKVYRKEDYLQPYEKLKTLENWTQYLTSGHTQKELDGLAYQYSDTKFAEVMQEEKLKLFKNINN